MPQANWPGSLLTVVVDCPAELRRLGHYRLALRSYPPLGQGSEVFAAVVTALPPAR